MVCGAPFLRIPLGTPNLPAAIERTLTVDDAPNEVERAVGK
jgi:hypothetical protein